MAGPARNLSAAEEAPLLSNRFVYRLTAVIAVLALLTVAISVGGHWFGQRIALAGHTDSREEFLMQIGQDKLKLPANTIVSATSARRASPNAWISISPGRDLKATAPACGRASMMSPSLHR